MTRATCRAACTAATTITTTTWPMCSPVLPRQCAAARHVPEGHQVRGRDHRHGAGHGARRRSRLGGVRGRHQRRLGEPGDRGVLLQGAGQGGARSHQAEHRHAGHCPRGAGQGGVLDGRRGAPCRRSTDDYPRRRRRDGRRSSTTRPSPSSGSAGNYPHGLIDPIEELSASRADPRHRTARRRLSRAGSCCRGSSSSGTRSRCGTSGCPE